MGAGEEIFEVSGKVCDMDLVGIGKVDDRTSSLNYFMPKIHFLAIFLHPQLLLDYRQG